MLREPEEPRTDPATLSIERQHVMAAIDLTVCCLRRRHPGRVFGNGIQSIGSGSNEGAAGGVYTASCVPYPHNPAARRTHDPEPEYPGPHQ